MKHIYILLIILFVANLSFAQNSPDDKDKNIFSLIEENNTSNNGDVTINQDYRLKLMMENHKKINKKQDGCGGYRLRIFSAKGNNSKNKSLEAKGKFMKQYPYTKSYLDYETPNFKILVGDFRTKSEAEKFRREIEKDFPNAFIVKCIIDFPKL